MSVSHIDSVIARLSDLGPKPGHETDAKHHAARIDAITREMRSCWFWQRRQKRALRLMRGMNMQLLFACYDLKPGGLVEVPVEWLSS